MGEKKARGDLMERTEIINVIGTEAEEAQRNWRVRMRKVQLLCPKCFVWFTLDKKQFKIDADGNVNDVVYHVCDAGDDDDHDGWVVLPQLVGWKS